MTEDNRVHPRFQVEAYAESEKEGRHRIENVSVGGICLESSTLETGETVELTLHLSDERPAFRVHGEVVWTSRRTPRQIGIRFQEMTEQEAAKLEALIQLGR